MRGGLRGKLIVAMVFVALASATVVGVRTQRFTRQQFERFLEVETTVGGPRFDVAPLLDHYRRHGTWAAVQPQIEALVPDRQWLLFDAGRRRVASNVDPEYAAGSTLLADGMLEIVTRHPGVGDGPSLERIELLGGIDLSVDGAPAGTLFLLSSALTDDPDPPARSFVRRVSRMHYWGIGIATLLALAIAVLVSRRIVGPVERLTVATRGLAAGDLERRVVPSGDDEIADLARAFNAMADTIERNEALRRQLVSDVAHELRTRSTTCAVGSKRCRTG